MPVDPTTDAHTSLERAAVEPDSLARWIEIGRHALRLVHPAELRPLWDVLTELRTLIVYEHWLSTGKNSTRTAADLDTSRRTVRRAVQARVRAPDTEGDARCPRVSAIPRRTPDADLRPALPRRRLP